jgi:hypothetical protein
MSSFDIYGLYVSIGNLAAAVYKLSTTSSLEWKASIGISKNALLSFILKELSLMANSCSRLKEELSNPSAQLLFFPSNMNVSLYLNLGS